MTLAIGQQITINRTMTQMDFDRFAVLSGDDNPIHVDALFAAQTRFGGTVAHGMFLYSNICRTLGVLLPGAVQIEQQLMFPHPTHADVDVAITAVVTAVTATTATLTTTTTNANGLVGCQGWTHLLRPSAALTKVRPYSQETAVSQEVTASASRMGQYHLGQTAAMTRTFTRADLAAYMDLVGDQNPIYTDMGYLPGALLGSLFSCLLGTVLPGRGTNWLKQTLRFPHPAYSDEAITAVVEIVRLRPEKQLVNLRTTCTDPLGTCVCEGEALVWIQASETHNE